MTGWNYGGNDTEGGFGSGVNPMPALGATKINVSIRSSPAKGKQSPNSVGVTNERSLRFRTRDIPHDDGHVI